MMNSKTVILTVLMSVTLFGCSNAQPPRVLQQPQAATSSKELKVVKACDIFTQNIALGLFQPAILEDTKNGPTPHESVSFCGYSNSEDPSATKGRQTVVLILRQRGAEAAAEFNARKNADWKEQKIYDAEPITLKGIGDDALLFSTFGSLQNEIFARKGTYILQLIRGKDIDDRSALLENSQEQFKTTMVKILANLK